MLRNTAYITGFFLISICLPLIFYSLGIELETENTENRELASMPDFALENTKNAGGTKAMIIGFYRDIKLFKDNYSKYFEDNFVLKDLFYSYYNSIQMGFFSTSPLPKKVIRGNYGWYFLGDSHSEVLLESKGIINYTEEEINQIKRTILERKQWLASKDITYYIAVAPNTHTVYGKYIPIQKADRPTKWDQLKVNLKSEEDSFIDLSVYYDQHPDKRLYHKTDSHWNDFGAFLGYKALIRSIKDKHPAARELNFDDFFIHLEVRYQQDLTKMLNIKEEEKIYKFVSKKPHSKRVASELNVPANAFVSPEEYEIRYKSNANGLKVLIFRDSYGTGISPFIQESFGESVIIWDHKFNEELIEMEKPDIVIHILVERSLDVFLD